MADGTNAAGKNMDVSIPELLRRTASEFANHTAVSFEGRKTDFAAFDRLSDSMAGSLGERGVGKGDRVGLYCPNSDAFAFAYASIVKVGAVVVPINLLLNPKEVAFILQDAGVKALIYAEALAEAVAAIRGSVPSMDFCISIGEKRPENGDLSWRDLQAENRLAPLVDWIPGEDLAAVLYTSGTTGYPKGAMLTHRNLVANTWSVKEALHLEPGRDTFLVVLPMFHSFAATGGMLFPLLHGCSFVPLARFDPESVARAIEATGATIFLGVPSMYNLLLRLPDEHVPRFRSLRFCVSGGAALPVEIMRAFEARFGKLIYEGDGPTECSPVTCVNPVGGKRKIGSVGRPVPAVEMKILDERGDELPSGEIGEICVRGPNVMKGYWRQPEETRASFFGEWFRTGDLGMRDEDGYFFIVDRKKDMIIVNGMNVYPRVVEEVLYRFPAVAEVAVVGDPHPLHGEIPVAYVVVKDGAETTAEAIRKHCLEHLGRHEVPRKLHFVAKLPKNASGKILKRELRKQGELERGVAIPTDS